MNNAWWLELPVLNLHFILGASDIYELWFIHALSVRPMQTESEVGGNSSRKKVADDAILNGKTVGVFFSLLNPLKNVSEIMRREVSTGGRSMRAVSPQSYSVISRLLQTFLLNSALARTNANWKRLFCTQTQFTLSLRLTLINLRISHMTPSGTT